MRTKQIIPLYKHQLATVDECENRNFFALLYETGAGKTPAATTIAREKYAQEGRVLRTLIICPLSIVRQWKDEFIRFAGNYYQDKIAVMSGSSEDKIAALTENTTIAITNIDSLNSEKVFKLLTNWNPELIILDESHMVKNIKAKRTKKALLLGMQAKYRFILTGTPQTNNCMDLWSQFHFLAPGKVFPDNYYVFLHTYFYDKNAKAKARMGAKYFPKYELYAWAFEAIKEKVLTCSHIVKKQDCIDLPPFVQVTREVPLDDEQKKIYDQMEKDFVAYINDEACVAQMAITKSIRLQQIIAGIFKTDEDKIRRIKTKRTEVLQEVLEGIGSEHKIIIWSVFIDTYKDIAEVCDKLNIKYAMLTGQQNHTEKQASIDAFRNNESTRVLIANPASGGTGLNLTEASYAIYYTRNFNLAQDIQSEARNYRSGSNIHEKVTRIDLVCPGTIDEHIMESLKGKKDMAEALMNYKKRKND